MKRENRLALKAELAAGFGGRCQRCGYDRSLNALHFHHLDPSEKSDWSGTSGRASLAEVSAHPERFLYLCANCHIEEHERLSAERAVTADCLNCGETFRTIRHKLDDDRARYCSRPCQHAHRKVLAPMRWRERFWYHVRIPDARDAPDACWEWTGAANGDYGAMNIMTPDGRHTPRLAHHLAYELAYDTPPPPRSLRWACGNKRCVRLDANHLSTRTVR